MVQIHHTSDQALARGSASELPSRALEVGGPAEDARVEKGPAEGPAEDEPAEDEPAEDEPAEDGPGEVGIIEEGPAEGGTAVGRWV